MTKISQDSVTFNPQENMLTCRGIWDIDHAAALRKQLKRLSLTKQKECIVDGAAITKLDSAGAYLLLEFKKSAQCALRFEHFTEEHQKLITLIDKEMQSQKPLPSVRLPSWVERIGRTTVIEIKQFIKYLSFIGELFLESLRVFREPKHLRLKATVSVVDKTGFQALPIIALISVMIGVVISYQMGNQLRNYGANVFIVDLLGLSVLREFGPLLAAIMVAGRTGSAFTAQIGIMRLNQEVDALNTMGVTPAELLLIPRLTGLFIALPLLTIWADFWGVLGGMVMATGMLGVSMHDFLMRFPQEIPLRTLLIGLGKAPIFALIIASVSCFEGMEVRGSAESVGTHTTRSVVLAIFFIIITDAIFSVVFSEFNL